MERPGAGAVTLFFCGDVMTGRGIDQVLPHPDPPHIFEPYAKSALLYVRLAEEANGPIQRPVEFSYIWGDALAILEEAAPGARIINLETAITESEGYERKGINYRMHPDNAPCLAAARVDCCSLANNHVLDWGCQGLAETLQTLKKAGIACAGAGGNLEEAEAPAIVGLPGGGRVLVFSFGSVTSGIPPSWAAAETRPGVNLLADYSGQTVKHIKEMTNRTRRPLDIVVASIHWGGNWGYEVPEEERDFAHRIIDEAGVDIVHGHSSHHVKGIEVHNKKLVLYGCGDFITDYEGISGYEVFRGDLGLMYFAGVDPRTGALDSLRMAPTRVRRFRVNRADKEDALWLLELLNREGRKFGTRFELDEEDFLRLSLG